MKTEFRNRAFLPLVMPLAILVAIGAVVGLVALILLYVDRQGAVALALLGAAGVLVAISLAASRDRLDAPRKGAVALAGVAPLAVGGLVAVGAIGGLADEDRNINVEPHQPQWVFEGIQEDAPVLAAEDATTFCLPGDGGCQPTNEWSFTYGAEQIQYAFDNRDTTAEHNLQIFEVPAEELDGIDGPLALDDLVNNYELITPGEPPTFSGPQAQTYAWAPPGAGAEGEAAEGAATEGAAAEGAGAEGEGATAIPERAYFVCTIHAGSMWGVVDIAPADA